MAEERKIRFLDESGKLEQNKTVTHINFVLDETGSMRSLIDEVINGFNKYVGNLKEDKDGLYKFSLLKFDSTKLEQVCDDVSLSEVVLLNKNNYRPGAATPLYDAISYSLKNISEKVKDNEKVLTIVFTDGQENSSVKTTLERLKDIIKEKENKGWAFMYMGVAIEAWEQKDDFVGTTMFNNAVPSAGASGMSASYAVAFSATQRYRNGASADSLLTDDDKTWVLNKSKKVKEFKRLKRDGKVVNP